MWKVSFSARKSIDKTENRMQELNICFDFQENYCGNAQIRSKNEVDESQHPGKMSPA